MERRGIVGSFAKPLLAALALAALSGCHYWQIFKEEMGNANEMLVKPYVSTSFMCWNVNAGGGTDGVRDVARAAAVVRAAGVDAAAILKLDRKTGRSEGIDQFDVLRRECGMHAAWLKVRDRGEGESGLAVLSREEPAKTRSVELEGGGCVLLLEFAEYVFAAVEFPFDEAERLKAVDRLRDLIQPDRPLVIAGSWEDEGEFATRLRRTFAILSGGDMTFPALAPAKALEHVAVSRRHRPRYEHVERKVLEEKVASDHRPLVVSVR